MRRSVLVLVLGAMLVLAAAGPALAKTPPFTVALSTTRPQPGETVNVTVRFWNDREHTKPATWPDGRAVRDLLWAVPVDAGGNTDLDAAVSITVRRVGPAEYRGVVTLTKAGSYVLVPFSVEGGFDAPAGYPQPIALDVTAASPAEHAPAGSGAGPWLPIALVAAGAGLLGALVARRARWARAPHAA